MVYSSIHLKVIYYQALGVGAFTFPAPPCCGRVPWSFALGSRDALNTCNVRTQRKVFNLEGRAIRGTSRSESHFERFCDSMTKLSSPFQHQSAHGQAGASLLHLKAQIGRKRWNSYGKSREIGTKSGFWVWDGLGGPFLC